MVHTFAYPARIEPDESGSLIVSFPDVPEALTFGDTPEQSMAEAADALGVALYGIVADGRDLPPASPVTGGLVKIVPSATMAAKIALNLAMREADTSTAEFARRMKIDRKEARRILGPKDATKLPRLEQALALYGQKMEVSFRAIPKPKAMHAVAMQQAGKRGDRRSLGRSAARRGVPRS
jgi:antitoxin HicB